MESIMKTFMSYNQITRSKQKKKREVSGRSAINAVNDNDVTSLSLYKMAKVLLQWLLAKLSAAITEFAQHFMTYMTKHRWVLTSDLRPSLI